MEGGRGAAGMQFLGDGNTVLSRFGHLKMFETGRKHHVWNAIAVDSGELRIVVGDFVFRGQRQEFPYAPSNDLCVMDQSLQIMKLLIGKS